MKFSRRTNTIILWIISIALLVGMIVMFTPTMGNLGGAGQNTSTPALLVNGESIDEIEVARAQQGNLYSRVREGEAGQDLELLLLDQLVQQEVLAQAASRVNVSGGEVRDAVNEFREQNGVAGRNNDRAYLNLIGRVGFTDESFRDYLREQLRLERYQEQLTDDVEVTEEEVTAFYELNRDEYRRDERIEARMIVVDDAELADELRAEAAAGADFAELARENSLERADRAGALGAPSGSEEPQPVGRAALPGEVAAVAFGLRDSGLTEVVASGSRYYIVQVDAYLDAEVQPLEEVRDQVQEDALAAKRGRVLEDEISRLREEATITVPEESQYSFENDVVARVGDTEIMETDLVRATYTNPQIQQALGPENADLIAEFFKPTILSQLIDRELAYVGAQELDANFVGSKGMVAQEALAWVSRDVTATEEELREYWESNQGRYTVPAEADATRIEFSDVDTAEAFRSALLAGAGTEDAASEFGGELEDLGTVREGDTEASIDGALFGTNAFESLPGTEEEVSDVLVVEEPAPEAEAAEEPEAASESTSEETDADTEAAPETDAEGSEAEASDEAEPGDAEAGDAEAAESPETVERFVVLVAERTPERVRPLDEVRAQVEEVVLSQKRSAAQAEWLESIRAEVSVVNLLAQAEPDTDGAAPAIDGEDGGQQTAPVEGTEFSVEPDVDGGAEGGAEDSAEDGTEGETQDGDTEDGGEDTSPQ